MQLCVKKMLARELMSKSLSQSILVKTKNKLIKLKLLVLTHYKKNKVMYVYHVVRILVN
jgi:hypothetical protein